MSSAAAPSFLPAGQTMHVDLSLQEFPEYVLNPNVGKMSVKMLLKNESNMHWLRFPDGTLQVANSQIDLSLMVEMWKNGDTGPGAPVVLGLTSQTDGNLNRWFFNAQDSSLRLLAYPDQVMGVVYAQKMHPGARLRYFNDQSNIQHKGKARAWNFIAVNQAKRSQNSSATHINKTLVAASTSSPLQSRRTECHNVYLIRQYSKKCMDNFSYGLESGSSFLASMWVKSGCDGVFMCCGQTVVCRSGNSGKKHMCVCKHGYKQDHKDNR